MVKLNKVRVSDFEPIVRAVYAEESFEFLNQYHHEGNGLDACVAKTVENIGSSRFFKVENEDAALVGFFVTDKIDGKDVMPCFHVRINYRTPEYLKAYWSLIRDTINNSFYTSVGTDNYLALQHLLKNDFEIISSLETDGKNFVILRTYL